MQGLWLGLLGAVLSLQLWFPNLDSEQHDTYSVEVAGRKALFELAEAQAESGRLPPVRRNHDSFSRAIQRLPEDGAFCLLGPSRYPNAKEWKSLLDWVQGGGSLLVAARWDKPEFNLDDPVVKIRIPKDAVTSAKTTPGKEAKLGTESKGKEDSPKTEAPKAEKAEKQPAAGDEKTKAATDENEASKTAEEKKSESSKKSAAKKKALDKQKDLIGTFETSLHPRGNLDWNSAAEIVSPAQAEVLGKIEEYPQIVKLPYGDGTILFVASDYIFSNDALFASGKDNSFLAYRLLETVAAGRQILVFDEFLNATGTPKVVGLLLNRALRPLTLQLFLLLVLLALSGTRRFGGLLPRAAADRHDITEHVNALGLLYYSVNNSRALLGVMLDQVRHDLRLHGDKFPDPKTWTTLAERLRQDPQQMKQLLVDSAAAVQDEKLNRRRAASLLKGLCQLRHSARQR